MVENSLDLLGFKRDFAGFVYNLRRVGWRGFWRRKPATQPASVGPYVWKPKTDRREHWFGLNSGGLVDPMGHSRVWTPLQVTTNIYISPKF